MKVLNICHNYYPAHEDKFLSGLESFSVKVHKLLQEYGHSSFIMASDDSTLRDFIPIGTLSTSSGVKSKLDIDGIISKINDLQPDIILSNLGNVKLMKFICKNNHRLIYMIHGILVNRSDFMYFKAVNTAKNLDTTGNFHIGTVCNYYKDVYNRAFPGIMSDDITIPLTYSDPNLFERESDDYYCYSGRLIRDKHSDIPIRWANKYGTKLKVIGNLVKHSNEFDWYETNIRPFLSDNIELIPHMPQSDLFKIISKCKALIVPAPDEASLIGFEAQKMGIPVITSKKNYKSGVEEYMIDGVTGHSVDTYRKRIGTVVDLFSNAISRADSLNRSDIHEIFKQKYSEKLFVGGLIETFSSILIK